MSELSEKILDTLIDAARQVSFNAYAPYSGFSVGAAVLTEGGDIYVGCNVENASFGLTNCAERSAVFSAVADGCGRGDFVALLLYTSGNALYSPCGACRQVLSEFFTPEGIIYSSCEAGKTVCWSMEALLPDAFVLLDEDE